MRVEQILYEYPYIQQRIKDIQREIGEVQISMSGVYEGLSCPLSRFGEAPLSAGRVGDPTGQAAILICDTLDDRIDRLRVEYNRLEGIVARVDAGLLQLDDAERNVIKLRYFERKRAREIAEKMDCTRQNCWHHQRKALKRLEGMV